jgi:hypothetical protein
MARGSTLGQVIDDLRIEAGMDPNPALSLNMVPQMKRALKREQERLYDEFDWPFLRVRRDIPLQAGERYYDIPDDMNLERIEDVAHRWGDRWASLDRGITIEQYNIYDSDADIRAEPAIKWDVHDTGDGAQLEIWPVPVTTGIQLRVTGIRKLTPLLKDADRLDLDDQMITLYVASEMLAKTNAKDAAIKQGKAIERFRTLTGRVIQTRKSTFNFNGPGRVDDRKHSGTPLVAYVRMP